MNPRTPTPRASSTDRSSFDQRRTVWIILFGVATWLSFSVGCGRSQLDRTWAAHEYPSKTSSPSGLGYLEKLCRQKGSRFKSVSRLSPRLDRADCLMLIGNTLHPPAKEARDWVEDWLAEKSGRSVIYFGRDFDASEYYLEQTLELQPKERKRRAGLDLAQMRAQRDDLIYEQMNADYFCRWFYIRVSKPQRVLEKFSGPWSEKLAGELKWPVRSFLDDPDYNLRDEVPDWANVPSSIPSIRLPKRFRTGKTTPIPAKPNKAPDTGRSVFTSFWVPYDIGSPEEWNTEWDLAPDCEKLLVGEDGTPLVMKLTSDRYPGSKILTIANGAPLFNAMMVNADWRQLCMNVADEIGDDARVALLPYNEGGIQVSHIPDIEDEVAGLSVLMTWPLNILMAHLAFLGIVLCVALFPILGRPQNLKAANLSDFGQHAEAMGRLLQATRDLPYALQLVRDYLRLVRGESPPAWLESELAKHSIPAVPSNVPALPLPQAVDPTPEKL